jgi:hypothetical protein
MTIVECINPFFEFTDKMEEAISNGAVPPQLGQQYEVLEDVFIDNVKDYPHLVAAGIERYRGYILKGIDFTPYGLEVAWRKGNFRVVRTEFIPNGKYNGMDVEHSKMRMTLSFDSNTDDIGNDDEIEEQTWIHNGE